MNDHWNNRFATLSQLVFRHFLVVLLALIAITPTNSPAHSPFDSNSRVIVSDETIEASVSVGMELSKELLKDTGQTFVTTGVGRGTLLPAELAPRFFEIEANGSTIPCTELRVMSDGLEALFTAKFHRPAAESFRLHARYAKSLPSTGFSALVVTDDNNQMLGSQIVKQDSATADFPLPALPGAIVETKNPPSVEATTVNPIVATTAVQQPTFADYFQMGVHHILSGLDHLLFLCGLLIVSRKLGGTLAIITCFTLAHSVTLGLAALDIISISARIVEPLIAASIIVVGLENFRKSDGVKSRCILAFVFGLIHGFGLAGALRDAGLGSTISTMIAGLLSFNLGVELGQLAIAAIFLALLWQLRKIKPVELYSTQTISIVVIALGCWWLVERTFLSHSA